jgi:hypothetical protein
MLQERRKQERIETDEIAYIFGDGSSLCCRVVNISAHGAAVELPEARHMRSRFNLMMVKDRVIRSCRLIWSTGDRIGVQFMD